MSDVTQLSGFLEQLGRFFQETSFLQLDFHSNGGLSFSHYRSPGPIASEQGRSDTGLLPYEANSFGTVFNLGSIGLLDDAALSQGLKELRRIAKHNIWIAVEKSANRDRLWWETVFFEAGFRRHPLSQKVVGFEDIQNESGGITLLFEKIPDEALKRYPLAALKTERDLHMDMLRESGVRAEAHLARYQLSAAYAKNAGVILDVACGLGYGSALLARQYPNARIIGIDISTYAIDYARANFASVLPNLEFHVADACELSMIPEGSVDLVVSFETIEHVPDPAKFLTGVILRMKPDAMFIGSVPNLWIDETGKDPNPWHFHVFDLPKFYQLFDGRLNVSAVYRQNAGGWLRNPTSGPVLRPVRLPVTDQLEDAEWWIIAAQKAPVLVTASAPRPKVWLIDGDTRGHLYANLQNSLDAEWIVGREAAPSDIDLAIVSDEWWWENSLTICALKRKGVPTLHVIDGVIDWKNTWENPRSTQEANGLPLFQPILCDKVACLGQAQARLLGAWGSSAKCEVVGAPRFDRYYGMKRRTRDISEPVRILVMTANTPYFNDEQHQAMLNGLIAVRDFFAAATEAGLPIEAVWRLTKGLDEEIGVVSKTSDFTGRELADILTTVDAVISSPSTALLESMLLGLPTAILDFSNLPHYIQPSWRITAPAHISEVVGELVNPSPAKLLHQETVLHDTLECSSPAAPRLTRLAATMINQGREARLRGESPVFAPNLLSSPSSTNAFPENRFDLATLYPGHAVFRMNKLAELQAELGHWRTRNTKTEPIARPETISPGVVILGEAKGTVAGQGRLRPASLDQLARFVGDDRKARPYFDEAEQHMERQWETHIWPLISKADFSNVLDLAAGHGRNSEKLRHHAKRIYVVDINQENIDHCRRRFAGDTRFTFIRNNGTSLQPIPNNHISLAYCFDAMVHFDSDVVRAYLREFHRVLRPGGLGFCHHSNYVGNPGGDVHDNKGWRNYMSESLFAHYCAKEGLQVIDSKLISWEARDSDCLTLFTKI